MERGLSEVETLSLKWLFAQPQSWGGEPAIDFRKATRFRKGAFDILLDSMPHLLL